MAAKPHRLFNHIRECLAEQPTRHFVYSAVVSECTFTVFLFTRWKAVISKELDYHKEPEVFVQMLLGIMCEDESMLGFDKHIYWTDSKEDRVQKIEFNAGTGDVIGTIKANIWRADWMEGRGTSCWTVEHEGKQYLVKDLWREEQFPGEWEFFNKLEGKDVDGVTKMISYEERGKPFDHPVLSALELDAPNINRVLVRMVFRHEGESIQEFKDVLSLLCAFHDAVRGKCYRQAAFFTSSADYLKDTGISGSRASSTVILAPATFYSGTPRNQGTVAS